VESQGSANGQSQCKTQRQTCYQRLTTAQTAWPNQYAARQLRIIRHTDTDDDGDDDGDLDTSDDLRHFYYNENWQCVEETATEGGSAEKQYVWHPYYIDALAVSYDDTGDKHFFGHDPNFNITVAFDDTGSVVERYRYSAYGEATILDEDYSLEGEGGDSSPDDDELSDIDNEFLYTGRRLDPLTGLYQYRYRCYHAPLGRFVNRDPIGYAGGSMNLYEYVRGNPIGFVDPFGNEHWHHLMPWEFKDFFESMGSKTGPKRGSKTGTPIFHTCVNGMSAELKTLADSGCGVQLVVAIALGIDRFAQQRTAKVADKECAA